MVIHKILENNILWYLTERSLSRAFLFHLLLSSPTSYLISSLISHGKEVRDTWFKKGGSSQ